MNLEQIYTGCLAHAAYYLESNGEAAIFDPLREVNAYILKASAHQAKIKFVFETHFHADFVSGHLDLAKLTGAKIVYGPTARPHFDALIANDGQVFEVGKCKVKLLHTPGHTMESSCYLLTDENGKEHGIITGDTLFIGDVGRPDLAQHVSPDLTEEKLALNLYDSLRNKIMPLGDDLIIYPNHGAGSACGKMMSKERTDTLGNQKKTNYALRADMTRTEFIAEVLNGLSPPPGYFPKNVLMNIHGYESMSDVLERGMKPMPPDEFELVAAEENILILDSRQAEKFAGGFIPNSINIGLDGSFANWAGELITDIKQAILLVTDPGMEEETIIRLARVGYDYVVGYLQGGFNSWKSHGKPFETIRRMNASDFMRLYQEKQPAIFDIRKPEEYYKGHVKGAINIPLNRINQHLQEFPKDGDIFLYCAGGYRSMIAASILHQRGWTRVTDIEGGFTAIAKTRIPKSDMASGVAF